MTTVSPCRCGELPVMRRIVLATFGPRASVACPACHRATPWCESETAATEEWNQLQRKPSSE